MMQNERPKLWPTWQAARQAFITALCSAAENRAGREQVPPALVVIAVRGDFWDQCAAVPELVSRDNWTRLYDS